MRKTAVYVTKIDFLFLLYVYKKRDGLAVHMYDFYNFLIKTIFFSQKTILSRKILGARS